MKNHFIASYAGNKRAEVVSIHDNSGIALLPDIDTIVEPFCGSAAFSYYMSTRYPGKYKYHLNDNDEVLTGVYRALMTREGTATLQAEIDAIIAGVRAHPTWVERRNAYNAIKNPMTPAKLVARKWLGTVRMYPLEKFEKKTNRKLETAPVVAFLRDPANAVVITHGDASPVFTKYEKNNRVFMFVDPPYISGYNGLYKHPSNMNVYEYLALTRRTPDSCYISACLENHWAVRLIFQQFDCTLRYDKTYNPSKLKTQHMVINLYKLPAAPAAEPTEAAAAAAADEEKA